MVYLRGFRGWFSGDVGGKGDGSGGFGNGYSSVSGEFFRLERTPAPFLVCYICLYMRINKLKVQPICCDENLL